MQATTWSWWTCTATQNTKQRAQGSVYTSQPDIYRPISLWHGLKAVCTHRNQTFTDLSHCGMGSRQCVHIATRHLQTYLTVACKWFYKKTHWFHWSRVMKVILQENPLISLIDESDFTRKPIDFTDWWKWFYKKTHWFHWLMKVILQENPLISLIDESDFTRKPIDFTDWWKWFYKKTHWFHWLMKVILQENPLISLIDESDFTRKPIDFTDWWKWFYKKTHWFHWSCVMKWFYKKTHWFHWLMKVILQENPLISLIVCDEVILQENPLISLIDESDFTRKPIDFTDWWKWFYKKTHWFHWSRVMQVILQENPLISLITCDESDFTRKPIDFTDRVWWSDFTRNPLISLIMCDESDFTRNSLISLITYDESDCTRKPIDFTDHMSCKWFYKKTHWFYSYIQTAFFWHPVADLFFVLGCS